MATIIPPYVDPGRASFEVMDTYLQSFLLAGQDPVLKPAFGFPLANNTSFLQFSVVGLDNNGRLTLATLGTGEAAATGTLTFSGVGTATETVTIGGVVYTLRAAPTTIAGEVRIGASATETASNLAAAINAGAGAGTAYGSLTPQHPLVSAVAAAGVITLTSRQLGIVGNQVATTETSAVAAFGAATLIGGLDRSGVRPIGVLAQAAALGSTGAMNGQVWYSGCFNMGALVWHSSFDTDAKKLDAFKFAGHALTEIIVAKRGA